MECEFCYKVFFYKHQLTVHKRKHTGEKPYECNVCNKRYSHLSTLGQHKRSTHTEVKPYECDVCKQRFSGHLARHKRTHTKPFECDVCKKGFSRKRLLKVHKKLHTGEKSFECDICMQVFLLSSDLASHKRTHIGKKPDQCDVYHSETPKNAEKCNECDDSEEQLLCNICGKETNSLLDVEKSTAGNKLECGESECNKKFQDSKSLILHKEKDHGIPYQCELCKKVIESTGIGYICSLCNIAFNTPKELENHMDAHSKAQKV